MQTQSWQYDVALSYAGEDREWAQALAKLIQSARYSVFYDEFEEFWGDDLSAKLHDIYGKQSRFCIIFISEHYLRKPWTNQERKVVISRAMAQETKYLLPIRIDDSELPGLPATTAFKDVRQQSIPQIFESLKQILGPPRDTGVTLVTEHRDVAVRMHPRNFLGIVIQKGNLETPWFNFDCHIINESRNTVRLQRLEAFVTRSDNTLQFMWNLLYDFLPGNQVMVKTADATTIELNPDEGRMLGVQFIGPHRKWEDLWRKGVYEFDLLGWVNKQTAAAKPDLRTRFRATIGDLELQYLSTWAFASDSWWEQLNDPHNAVAIPLKIDKSSLVVG